MRLTRMVAAICALCLVTGLVIYGGISLWPQLADSSPLDGYRQNTGKDINPQYLYSIGGPTGPKRPNAVMVYQDRVYVTDAAGGQVFVYSEKGKELFRFGKSGDAGTDFVFPNGIVVNSQGNLMISDSVSNDIKVYTTAGEYLQTLPVKEKMRPGFMLKGPDGLIYVSDLMNNRILVINERGTLMRTIADAGNILSYPQGLAFDRSGRLWAADSGHYSIKIFDKDRVIAEIKGGGIPETPFSMVRGITFDRSGRAYITDTVSRQVRIFDLKGRQLSVFSSSRQYGSELVFPTGLFAGDDGKLFVVDRGTGNVQVFSVNK